MMARRNNHNTATVRAQVALAAALCLWLIPSLAVAEPGEAPLADEHVVAGAEVLYLKPESMVNFVALSSEVGTVDHGLHLQIVNFEQFRDEFQFWNSTEWLVYSWFSEIGVTNQLGLSPQMMVSSLRGDQSRRDKILSRLYVETAAARDSLDLVEIIDHRISHSEPLMLKIVPQIIRFEF